MLGAGGGVRDGGRQGSPKRPHAGGKGERSEGAPPNRDPHRPWRRNLRFLRPKMRTLEKMSTRLPLQSPRFLLGLLRLLPADGRSQCCSRACRFWRIKPLAMAAAMVAPGPGPEEGGAEGRELGTQSGKGRRGGQAGGAGAGGWQRSVPPGTHRPLRGARGRARKCARGAAGRTPGARGRARRRRRVGAGTGAGAGAAGAAARAAFLPGPPPGREVEPAAFFPSKERRAGAGRVPRVGPPRARWAGLSVGLERPPGRCRRCRPLSESAGDCQVSWRSASGERNLLPGDLKSERFVPSPLHSPPVPLLGQSSEGKKKVYI